uniref:Uncharacterized protein n=1 Tax=Physcomitrium patens TaxID=3218 RepID=A0A2K1L8S4_PHYPA|nr:hypothetical protein PHYPA_000863 [Physcomitrium patens]
MLQITFYSLQDHTSDLEDGKRKIYALVQGPVMAEEPSAEESQSWRWTRKQVGELPLPLPTPFGLFLARGQMLRPKSGERWLCFWLPRTYRYWGILACFYSKSGLNRIRILGFSASRHIVWSGVQRQSS